MNSKSNTKRGEMNGGERTGKDFANILNLDRDRTRNRGASGERLERRGISPIPASVSAGGKA